MSWITYSLIMFFSSVALYLSVRKASLLKAPTQLTNLAMFAIPLVAYTIIGVGSSTSLRISAWQLLLLIVASVLFAYGGNKASLRAIDIAPNPGYSLVISKSYVLFTTIVAVILLNAEITAKKLVAVLLIVGFSTLVMVNREASKKVKGANWVLLSVSAFFGWGLLSLTSKYLFNHGVEPVAFLMYLYAIVTICIIAFDKIRDTKIRDTTREVKLMLLSVGFFSTLFNYGQFQAIKLAPNIGYVNAINAASISMVTVCAVLLFKDELTIKKAVGILGVTLGLVLLLV